jgi:hypothetical protein
VNKDSKPVAAAAAAAAVISGVLSSSSAALAYLCLYVPSLQVELRVDKDSERLLLFLVVRCLILYADLSLSLLIHHWIMTAGGAACGQGQQGGHCVHLL